MDGLQSARWQTIVIACVARNGVPSAVKATGADYLRKNYPSTQVYEDVCPVIKECYESQTGF